jgi:hypothetical protein
MKKIKSSGTKLVKIKIRNPSKIKPDKFAGEIGKQVADEVVKQMNAELARRGEPPLAKS